MLKDRETLSNLNDIELSNYILPVVLMTTQYMLR